MSNVNYQQLTARAEKIVKQSIKGHRKGMPDVPNYTHSIRVASLLKKYGFHKRVQLAGLLHDVVEDGAVTFHQLLNYFPKEVVDIVRLCTHDSSINVSERRWALMVVKLTRSDSADAWAVKLADAFDNMLDAHTLAKEREMFMRQVKVPVLLFASEHLIGKTPLWEDLNQAGSLITYIIKKIDELTLYIRQQLEEELELSDNVLNTLLGCCNKIDHENYGMASDELGKAILKLHDTAMLLAEDESIPEAKTLQLLANCLCGDMLYYCLLGKSARKYFRQDVNEQGQF